MANLDRLITLAVQGESVRDDSGVTQPGPEVFNGKIWAELRAGVGELNIATNLFRLAGDRTFRIRYRQDIALGHLNRFKITDDLGIEYNLSRVILVDRRRYLDLDCARRQ